MNDLAIARVDDLSVSLGELNRIKNGGLGDLSADGLRDAIGRLYQLSDHVSGLTEIVWREKVRAWFEEKNSHGAEADFLRGDLSGVPGRLIDVPLRRLAVKETADVCFYSLLGRLRENPVEMGRVLNLWLGFGRNLAVGSETALIVLPQLISRIDAYWVHSLAEVAEATLAGKRSAEVVAIRGQICDFLDGDTLNSVTDGTRLLAFAERYRPDSAAAVRAKLGL